MCISKFKMPKVKRTYSHQRNDKVCRRAPTRSTLDGCSSLTLRLDDTFYDVPCEELAHVLLGQRLVRVLQNGIRLSGRIVETESYLGGEDKASNTYHGRRSEANKALYMKPGTTYVYMTYGMYHCINISSQGDGAGVLIRALEPIEGLEEMRKHRGVKRKDGGSKIKDKEMCNGPSKLCMSLDINKTVGDQQDLVNNKYMWIERGQHVSEEKIVKAPRIGIGPKTGEWMLKPLRFYIRDCDFVSVRNEKAEQIPGSN